MIRPRPRHPAPRAPASRRVILAGVAGLVGLGILLGAAGAEAQEAGAGGSAPVGKGAADDKAGLPVSVAAIPSTIESVLHLDFGAEGGGEWMEAFAPRPRPEGRWALPESIVKKLSDAGTARFTLGGRRFALGEGRWGEREEISIRETQRALSDVQAELAALADSSDEVAATEAPSGKLYRVTRSTGEPPAPSVERWVGIDGDRFFILSTERSLVEEALVRSAAARAGGDRRPIFQSLIPGTDWSRPFVLLRLYDRNNQLDRYSPLNKPRGTLFPQARPFKVLGLRVVAGAADPSGLPSADLDVRTEEPDAARAYYHELLQPETRMAEPAPPGAGWARFRLAAEEDRVNRFVVRLLFLYGYNVKPSSRAEKE